MKATPPTPSCDNHSATPVTIPAESPRAPISERKRNALIEEYLPAVGSVLAKLRRNLPLHVNTDDLYSAGVTGLIAAADRYDPTQLASFPSYVRLRIRCAILDELRRLDSCTRRSRARNKEIKLAVGEIEQVLGRAPTDLELSARLKITVTELRRWRATSEPIRLVSLDGDTEKNGDTVGSLHEVIMDHNQESVRETMEKQEMMEILAERLAALPDVQKRILSLYYFEGVRFGEIAEVFGLSEARICQIHKQAVAKLQSSIRAFHLGKPYGA